MQDLRVSIVQDTLDWEDAGANRTRFAQALADLAGKTDLIVLPEMFTTGFSMNAAALAESVPGTTTAWMTGQARETGAAVCGSLIAADGTRYYNRLVFVTPDGEMRSYDKRHLFRMAGEHEHYEAGTDALTIRYRGWRVCPLICYDLRFPVFARRVDSCDLMLFVANWPAPRAHAWRTLLTARAIENICYVAGVNRIGTDGKDIPYTGQSGVIDYVGEWLADPGDAARVSTVTLDAASLAKFRDRFPFHLDADEFSLRSSGDESASSGESPDGA